MIACKSDEVTTLLLDPAYMPFGVATARAAFYSLLKNKGTGISADGSPYDWNRYISNTLNFLPDQPTLRGGFNASYASNEWRIPTIFVVNKSFFYNRNRKKPKCEAEALPSVKEVWDYYDGKCCFCHTHVKMKDATREHVHSRAFGGGDEPDNIALAHSWCNSNAGSAMPKIDVFGNIIEAKLRITASHYSIPENLDMRPEWKPYLFQD